jgi:hypothetical protein
MFRLIGVVVGLMVGLAGLVFGLLGGGLGVIFGLAGAFFGVLFGLMFPLAPFLLLGLVIWLLVRPNKPQTAGNR